MGGIGEILGTPLGYIMKFCYDVIGNYGISIIVFTLITKVILLPVSLLVQKNSVKMIKMKPQLDALKYQYVDDKDTLLDEQTALYKKEKYSPFAGTIPLLLQLPLIFGLIDVVYRPLRHLLRLPQEVIQTFTAKTSEILGMSNLGSSPELVVMQCVNDPKNQAAFEALRGNGLDANNINGMIEKIQSVDMNFLGVNLAETPSLLHMNILFLIPVLAGLSALIMCIIQNKINVLQIEQNALSQWGMTIFMIAFSGYFAFLVPSGVGIYWIFGNLFAIPVMYLVNIIYSPKKYIDYDTLNKMKEKAKADHLVEKENTKLSKQHYKEICKDGNLEKMNLMFYSEQSGFYKYFQNIIEALLANSDEVIYYVTSDPQDEIFKKASDRIKPYYISGNQLIALMMKLECKIVVMTMPDLEKYHIKRSKVKKDIEYIYVDHACVSLSMSYRPGALDYFDTIFAVCKRQGIEVREMERLRKTKRKRVVKCGYGLIDNMIAAYQADENTRNEKPTILIAPSWQYDNILDSCLDDMLSGLICDKYKVVVRPHPQYIRRFPMQMEAILEKYKDKFSEDFRIETDFSSNVTVYTADLVITDWSAIAFEFSFTTNKPTLFINTEIKVLNKDYDKIKVKPYEVVARNLIGKAIEKEDVVRITEVIQEMLDNQASYEQRIEEMKQEYFYNLGNSGEVGAEYIIERLSKCTISTE